MKPNELRIKNKVAFLDKIVTVEAITNEFVSISGHEYNRFTPVALSYTGLQPIPITEDILLKCRFFKEEDRSYRWYLGEYFTYDLDDGGFKYEGTWIRPLIKHLHELQNLYFALTQTELEFKSLKNE